MIDGSASWASRVRKKWKWAGHDPDSPLSNLGARGGSGRAGHVSAAALTEAEWVPV